MTMFLIGALTMYLLSGIIILILNSINVDEDIIDCVFAWWLLPLCYVLHKIREKRFAKEEKEKLKRFLATGKKGVDK